MLLIVSLCFQVLTEKMFPLRSASKFSLRNGVCGESSKTAWRVISQPSKATKHKAAESKLKLLFRLNCPQLSLFYVRFLYTKYTCINSNKCALLKGWEFFSRWSGIYSSELQVRRGECCFLYLRLAVRYIVRF